MERYSVTYDAVALAARQPKVAPSPMRFGAVSTARTQARMASKWGVGPAHLHDDADGTLLATFVAGQLVFENQGRIAAALCLEQRPRCTECDAMLDLERDARRHASPASGGARVLPTVCRMCREARSTALGLT